MSFNLPDCPSTWWNWLPKRSVDPTRPTRTQRTGGARTTREHDPQSRLIGDGPGYGGFQNPVYVNAIDYFLRTGSDAPASVIIDTLREIISAAPKDKDRDVSRYMTGDDLPRIVERARDFVTTVNEND